jgi:primase-polymerase (primpol)-like protein
MKEWANVPEALRLAGRWTTWRYYERDGRKAKLPAARVNEPRTWTTFEEAVRRAMVSSVRDHGGIGFLLGNGWCGVDIDGVVDGSGDVREDVRTILAEIGGYHEISPSGTGVKCIGRGDRIGLELNYKLVSTSVETPIVTAWTGARFFTITGCVIPSSGDPLDDLNLSRWPQVTTRKVPVAEPRPLWIRPGDSRGTENLPKVLTGDSFTDNDLIALACRREKFLRLWQGDIGAYGRDHSRADAALCTMLAFYTGKNPERMDRLFRRSKLMRPKWETRSYRNATIAKALVLTDSIMEMEINEPHL